MALIPFRFMLYYLIDTQFNSYIGDKRMPYKEIGARIRTLREHNNYTRETFAESIGISSKFLYEIEMGKKGFSADTLLRISRVLSVSCDYLLTGSSNDNRAVERIICILESFEPRQMGHLRDILVSIMEMMQP